VSICAILGMYLLRSYTIFVIYKIYVVSRAAIVANSGIADSGCGF